MNPLRIRGSPPVSLSLRTPRPTKAEANDLADYAAKYGMANLCRLILNSNEFMFVN